MRRRVAGGRLGGVGEHDTEGQGAPPAARAARRSTRLALRAATAWRRWRPPSTAGNRPRASGASTAGGGATARRTRAAHPLIGGLLLTLGGTPRHESAFHSGERGEQAVAASLEQRTARGPAIVLHDRRMPCGRGNIDHLAVAPSGVYVIDAKNIRGKVRVANPLFGGQRLMINGRDRSALIDGLDRQVHAVRGVLAAGGRAEVPVQGVLCFTTADLPLLGTLNMRGHLLLYRRALGRRLNASGPLGHPAIETLARLLVDALPSA